MSASPTPTAVAIAAGRKNSSPSCGQLTSGQPPPFQHFAIASTVGNTCNGFPASLSLLHFHFLSLNAAHSQPRYESLASAPESIIISLNYGYMCLHRVLTEARGLMSPGAGVGWLYQPNMSAGLLWGEQLILLTSEPSQFYTMARGWQ